MDTANPPGNLAGASSVPGGGSPRAAELAAIEPSWPENEYNVYAPPGFCGDIECTCARDALTFMTREQFMLAFTARPEDLDGDDAGVIATMTED